MSIQTPTCLIFISGEPAQPIKMYTSLLQKLQILLQWYGWAIQQSQASANHRPQSSRKSQDPVLKGRDLTC